MRSTRTASLMVAAAVVAVAVVLGVVDASYSFYDGTWEQLGMDIDGTSTNIESGSAVAISANGTIVAIGAPFANINNQIFTGSATVVQYNNSNNASNQWDVIGSSLNNNFVASEDDQSGYSIAISNDGSIVAIGAPKADGSNGTNSGKVRVYRQTTKTGTTGIAWEQIGSDIDGETRFDQFGFSVVLSGDGTMMAIGARLNDGPNASRINTGHVRVYQLVGSNYVQIGSDIDGEGVGDESGYQYSIAMSNNGTIVAIGAYLNDGQNGVDSGHVRVFQLLQQVTPTGVTMEWVQVGTDIDGEGADDESGFSVDLSSDGSVVAIGAPKNRGDCGTSDSNFCGHVRVYQLTSNNNKLEWVQLGSDIDGLASGDQFGYTVAISGDGTLVASGAPRRNVRDGQVRVFRRKDDDTTSTTEWVQIGQNIDGEGAVDEAGYAIAMSKDGTTLAIGSRFNDGTSVNGDGSTTVLVNSGHVRVFKFKSAPTSAPTDSPTKDEPNRRCGLFGLGLFCLRGCGFFRRLFNIGNC